MSENVYLDDIFEKSYAFDGSYWDMDGAGASSKVAVDVQLEVDCGCAFIVEDGRRRCRRPPQHEREQPPN